MAKPPASGGKTNIPFLKPITPSVPASLKPPPKVSPDRVERLIANKPAPKVSPDRVERLANTNKKQSSSFQATNIADKTDREIAKSKAADAALKKLTGGQKLTANDKRLLNIGGKKTTVVNNKKPANTNKTKTNTKTTKKPTPTAAVVPSEESSSTGADEQVSPTPNTPEVDGSGYTPPTAKPATPDLIQLNEEAFPVEIMTDLLFEDIGGTELLNFARHDMVNGIDIKYHQISNLDKIEAIYGSGKLISLQETSEQIFSKFPLKRYQYVPDKTDDPSGFNGAIYLDASGDLVIELGNLTNSNQIEVEFQAADTNDIIY